MLLFTCIYSRLYSIDVEIIKTNHNIDKKMQNTYI